MGKVVQFPKKMDQVAKQIVVVQAETWKKLKQWDTNPVSKLQETVVDKWMKIKNHKNEK